MFEDDTEYSQISPSMQDLTGRKHSEPVTTQYPAEIPPPPQDFTGRDDELKELMSKFDRGATGRRPQGHRVYEQALVIDREIGDRRGEGNALWNLSLSQAKLGQRKEAISNAKAALKIRDEIEYPRAEKVRRKQAEWQE
jgi:tetratricopeptide (TPR) repeat protein